MNTKNAATPPVNKLSSNPAAQTGGVQPRRVGPLGHGGPMAMMKGEKPRDFKGTMSKLISYLGAYKLAIIVAMVFAIASTVFSIVGPKVLGIGHDQTL